MHSASSSDVFGHYAPTDACDLIAQYPLAWVSPAMADKPASTLLPLLLETDAVGVPKRLIGHVARRNPMVAALTHDPSATILFNGPQGYVAAEHAQTPGWIPTWNYAQLVIEARITFEPEQIDAALERLTDAMEAGRDRRWRVGDAGERYARMAAQVIAFRADITSLTGRFKLGQDERTETLRHILARHPDAALTAWMRRMNAGRLIAT